MRISSRFLGAIVSPEMDRVNHAPDGAERGRGGIGGWLLVLGAVLLVWQPINLALIASTMVGQIAVRGASLAIVLVARVLVTALGMAAGIALVGRRDGAVGMAKAALVASAAIDVFIYTTSYAPGNRMPGDAPLYVAGSLAYHGIWLTYLVRSKRVKNTF